MFGVKENIDNAVYNTISVAYQQEVVQNKVNINTATFEQLKMLPGVGEGKATDIINHRPYCDIYELRQKTPSSKSGDECLHLVF